MARPLSSPTGILCHVSPDKPSDETRLSSSSSYSNCRFGYKDRKSPVPQKSPTGLSRQVVCTATSSRAPVSPQRLSTLLKTKEPVRTTVQTTTVKQALVKLLGVGNTGIGGVKFVREHGSVPNAELWALDTDSASLRRSQPLNSLLLGEGLEKRHHGAGRDVAFGSAAAEDSALAICKALKGKAGLAMVVAGLGEGVGGGAGPVVAACAKAAGHITVGVVIRPFGLGGGRRMQNLTAQPARVFAERTDMMITVDWDVLRRISIQGNSEEGQEFTLAEAQLLKDGAVLNAARAVSALLQPSGPVYTLKHGLTQMHPKDVQRGLSSAGKSAIGFAGASTLEGSLEAALGSPFLAGALPVAKGVLCVVTVGPKTNLSLQALASATQKLVGSRLQLLFTKGQPELSLQKGQFSATLILTGLPADFEAQVDCPTTPKDNLLAGLVLERPNPTSIPEPSFPKPRRSLAFQDVDSETEPLKLLTGVTQERTACDKEDVQEHLTSTLEIARPLDIDSSESQIEASRQDKTFLVRKKDEGVTIGEVLSARPEEPVHIEDDSNMEPSEVHTFNSKQSLNDDLEDLGTNESKGPSSEDSKPLCDVQADTTVGLITDKEQTDLLSSQGDAIEQIEARSAITVREKGVGGSGLSDSEESADLLNNIDLITDSDYRVQSPETCVTDSEQAAGCLHSNQTANPSDQVTASKDVLDRAQPVESTDAATSAEGPLWFLQAEQAVEALLVPDPPEESQIPLGVSGSGPSPLLVHARLAEGEDRAEPYEEEEEESSVVQRWLGSLLQSQERVTVKERTLQMLERDRAYARYRRLQADTVLADGSHYVGQVVGGQPDGEGRRMYIDASCYEGCWLKGRRHGYGCMTDMKGNCYKGEWKQDLKHGKGWMEYKSGHKVHALFEQGRVHGPAIIHYANGDLFKGTFVQNERHGPGLLVKADGQRWQQLWEYGKRVAAIPMDMKEDMNS